MGTSSAHVTHCQPSDAGSLAQRQLALRRRDFSVDEAKSTAAESCQDRGPLVRLISTSTFNWSRPHLFVSVMFWCHRSSLFGILAFTSTLMSPCHVTNVVRACFLALRQIRSVRRSLPQHAVLTLVHALVITKLDHCNSVLAGTAGYLQNRLQSVLNAAARLIFSRRASEHTTPLLRDLHWLSVPERIQFRLCVLAYHCVHGTAPVYLTDSLRPTSEFVARRHLRSADIRCWCRRFVG